MERRWSKWSCISIHSLRMEGDLSQLKYIYSLSVFQSTPSAWRETVTVVPPSPSTRFQSTPSAWRETFCLFHCNSSKFISIHSLRMEGDSIPSIASNARFISIHSLRMEGDNFDESNRTVTEHFNPLPPHGGRRAVDRGGSNRIYFNPLPPHGGRLYYAGTKERRYKISIHSLRMEGDSPVSGFSAADFRFQSTPSAWRETQLVQSLCDGLIHFNPLPPHGGRLQACVRGGLLLKFQSTPSAWRETLNRRLSLFSRRKFQSTPSAWRETNSSSSRLLSAWNFNPLPPHGGRPIVIDDAQYLMAFQSTPSAWRETGNPGGLELPRNHFNPLPPHGGRLFRLIRFRII